MTFKQLERIPARTLQCELLRRAIARTEEALNRATETVEVLQQKHLRQKDELRRQRSVKPKTP